MRVGDAELWGMVVKLCIQVEELRLSAQAEAICLPERGEEVSVCLQKMHIFMRSDAM
jgi:hypothetical protein